MRSSPNEYDKRLGLKIAAQRIALGLTQTALGQALGVSFQQIQKYEKGRNRVPASKYAAICVALKMTLADLIGVEGTAAPSLGDRLSAEKGGLELADIYLSLSAQQRRLMLAVAREFAGIASHG